MVLAWIGRDVLYEEKEREFSRLSPAERAEKEAPPKHKFPKGFHRGMELFGQHAARLQEPGYRDLIAACGIIVVEGFNDVIGLDNIGIPAVAMMSLRPYGTPSRGRAWPVIHRSVDSLAWVVARSTSQVRTALTRPSSCSMSARIYYACEHLDGCHGACEHEHPAKSLQRSASSQRRTSALSEVHVTHSGTRRRRRCLLLRQFGHHGFRGDQQTRH